MTKKPIYKSLYFQVIVAIIAGILVGHFFPSGTQVINGVEKYNQDRRRNPCAATRR